jgi:hypothetical protein
MVTPPCYGELDHADRRKSGIADGSKVRQRCRVFLFIRSVHYPMRIRAQVHTTPEHEEPLAH